MTKFTSFTKRNELKGETQETTTGWEDKVRGCDENSVHVHGIVTSTYGFTVFYLETWFGGDGSPHTTERIAFIKKGCRRASTTIIAE